MRKTSVTSTFATMSSLQPRCFVVVKKAAAVILTFLSASSLAQLQEKHHAEPIAAEAPRPIWKVLLTKQYVPVRINSHIVSYKTAYSGKVYLGFPASQVFTVVFDTGSGHFFIPSMACLSEACQNLSRYNRTASGTAVDINDDGTEASPYQERDQVAVTYGTGEVSGEFVREVVCLGEAPRSPHISEDQHHCTMLRVITARQMSKEPFSKFNFDGVLGLSLHALALHPEFNFFHQLTQDRHMEPVFAVWLSTSDEIQSEITFGGHDAHRRTAPMSWVPVAFPQRGYWQVSIHGITIGNTTLPICQAASCTAVLDSGTSLLGVPSSALMELRDGLSRVVPGKPTTMDCRDFPGPSLVFHLADGLNIELDGSDYSRPAAALVNQSNGEQEVVCRASLLPIEVPSLGSKVFLWGEPVLRRYYTAYDTRNFQIGFAPAAQPTVGENAPAEADAEMLAAESSATEM